jgi:addiction module RelB/DinJ family antitoxin
MSKTATVRAMIDPHKKDKVEKILKRIGINHSEAINIFYSLIEEYQGFPFELRLPDSDDKTFATLDSEILSHLKTSVKKNRKLGELLAQ